MTITGDQKFLKNINRMALVRLIRSEPGLSRADLATHTGLTKSTVSLLVQELIDEGWLAEDDALVTGSIGRRPTPLRLDTTRLALIGGDLSLDFVEATATTLTGEVLEIVTRQNPRNDVDEILAALADAILTVSRHVQDQGRSILGLGIGVPGPVHASSGVLRSSAAAGWKDVPVRAALEQHLTAGGLPIQPILLQRRAACAALGEVEFASMQIDEPLLYIHLGLNVGAGMFVRDRLLSGHGGFAGDVGHQQLVPDGPLCTCGRHGCAEALISLRAMSEALGVTPNEFKARLAVGDSKAHDVLRYAGHYLGVMLHNLWSTFDPAQIVLGGPCCRLGDAYVDAARNTLNQLAAQAGLSSPNVTVTRFGEHAVSIGATALVLHQLVRPV
ncbi:ROK family transcriptional regulator [Uliginosibacterium sp. H1]|uniref:ROK family transcriptional regulator n=1 Tax=Uliginosibacterium sp. H1 TaxID=3114757 RepID=UPI002E16E704|nr:ROK family transcriptional regulator [Uliginosibacterium sp. H1]